MKNSAVELYSVSLIDIHKWQDKLWLLIRFFVFYFKSLWAPSFIINSFLPLLFYDVLIWSNRSQDFATWIYF